MSDCIVREPPLPIGQQPCLW